MNVIKNRGWDQSPKCLKFECSDFRQLGPINKGVLSQSPDCPKSEQIHNGKTFCLDFGVVPILDVRFSDVHCISLSKFKLIGFGQISSMQRS